MEQNEDLESGKVVMAENSGISWTTHTFNPWMGCTKVSPACQFCYAERDMDHRFRKVQWGPSGNRIITTESNWKLPLKWNKDAQCKFDSDRDGNCPRHLEGCPRPRVFCASLADVFEDWDGPILNSRGHRLWHDHVSGETFAIGEAKQVDPNNAQLRYLTMDDVRRRLFKLIDATPNLDWLLLTKRPENIRKMWQKVGLPDSGIQGTLGRRLRLDNIWLGTTVENQDYANKRIPELLKCRDLSPVLFLSCEPLLGPIDLRSLRIGAEFDKTGLPWFDALDGTSFSCDDVGKGYPSIDWVIAGGESGPEARPSNPGWFRSLRDQCADAGVPFHFKQWGEWAPSDLLYERCKSVDTHAFDEDSQVFRVGKKQAGRLLDDVLHDAFPSVVER